jgi:hypothetical protein
MEDTDSDSSVLLGVTDEDSEHSGADSDSSVLFGLTDEDSVYSGAPGLTSESDDEDYDSSAVPDLLDEDSDSSTLPDLVDSTSESDGEYINSSRLHLCRWREQAWAEATVADAGAFDVTSATWLPNVATRPLGGLMDEDSDSSSLPDLITNDEGSDSPVVTNFMNILEFALESMTMSRVVLSVSPVGHTHNGIDRMHQLLYTDHIDEDRPDLVDSSFDSSELPDSMDSVD